ncbi:unnamed protein product [Thelazia callipaeda]|uniref:UmuC domain-containing protein n=1 Tax=Thelazia callipaeda TaxID=103827 RepID=A0A0N5CM11_THECL|nr:unnamed protein product [Thelazia callipaeda]
MSCTLQSIRVSGDFDCGILNQTGIGFDSVRAVMAEMGKVVKFAASEAMVSGKSALLVYCDKLISLIDTSRGRYKARKMSAV